MNLMCDSFQVFFRLAGTVDNSPAIHCWEEGHHLVVSPGGTAEATTLLFCFQSSLLGLNIDLDAESQQ